MRIAVCGRGHSRLRFKLAHKILLAAKAALRRYALYGIVRTRELLAGIIHTKLRTVADARFSHSMLKQPAQIGFVVAKLRGQYLHGKGRSKIGADIIQHSQEALVIFVYIPQQGLIADFIQQHLEQILLDIACVMRAEINRIQMVAQHRSLPNVQQRIMQHQIG